MFLNATNRTPRTVVSLQEEQRDLLQRLVGRRTAPAREVLHAPVWRRWACAPGYTVSRHSSTLDLLSKYEMMSVHLFTGPSGGARWERRRLRLWCDGWHTSCSRRLWRVAHASQPWNRAPISRLPESSDGLRGFFPESVPRGITTVLISILFFGSINLLAISLVGEYIAKILALRCREWVSAYDFILREARGARGQRTRASLPALVNPG